MGSKIFIFDNFYLEPYKLLKYITIHKSFFHKSGVNGSFNGVKFFDKRHKIPVSNIYKDVYFKLENIVNQKILYPNEICTNFFKFKDSNFNVCRDYYWYPHLDEGYTGIIYLNDDCVSTTNLYEPNSNLSVQQIYSRHEHVEPWVSKDMWKNIFSIKGNFNRLVIFDAKKFWHGMDLSDFFNERWRKNQVIFFQQ
ncbi:MAG: hypothetical protein VW262_09165 [Flavobacteriaceae bacterium]